MTPAMADELYERYRRLSHTELYRQLAAGSPTEVTRLAASWRAVENAMSSFAAALRRDLAALRPHWEGTGGQEYQYRVGLIATVAEQLAEEATAIRTGLTLMATTLADAQRRAEPDHSDTPEWTVTGVLGPELGHAVSAAERTRAQETLARLVADLAADYALTRHQNWRALPAVPVDLPGAFAEVHHDHHDHHDHDRPEHATHLLGLGGLGGHARPVAEPVVAPAPVAAAPAAPVPAGALLTGAGSTLAASAATGHLATQSQQRSAAAEPSHTGPAGQAPMPMLGAGVGGVGGVGVGPTDAGGASGSMGYGYHRGPDGATSWSSGENVAWIDADEEPPPAVLGDTA